MQDQTRERARKFWKTDNYWLALLRDILVAFLVVAVIISIVYAYSGSVTPLVAVQSGSMEHDKATSLLDQNNGIYKGDVVLIKKTTDVVTYKQGINENYMKFGNYGDVIVYKPNGDDRTPIIHRAMYWVNAGDRLPNNQTATHAGYITKGDANVDYDQPLLFGSMPPVEPVKPEWIIGVAQYRVPLIGNLRLSLPTVITPLVKVSAECQSMPIFSLTNSFTLSRLNPLLDYGGYVAGAKLAAKPF
ncbi:MAG: S26 family signal peptidase [Halobacteriota archaeon]